MIAGSVIYSCLFCKVRTGINFPVWSSAIWSLHNKKCNHFDYELKLHMLNETQLPSSIHLIQSPKCVHWLWKASGSWKCSIACNILDNWYSWSCKEGLNHQFSSSQLFNFLFFLVIKKWHAPCSFVNVVCITFLYFPFFFFVFE